MSAYNTGQKSCEEIGCACWNCEYRNTDFSKKPKDCQGGSCGNCEPDLPLDYCDEGDGCAMSGSYGGISKCSCYKGVMA